MAKKRAARTVGRPLPAPLPLVMAGGQTKAQLAAELGISPQCFQRWLGKGCPPGPAAAVRDWQAVNVNPNRNPHRDRSSSDSSSDSSSGSQRGRSPIAWAEDKARSEALKVREQLKKLRFENAKAAGDLLPRDLVERLFSELVLESRQQFQSVAESMRTRFPPEQQNELVEELRNLIEGNLRRLAAWRPSFALAEAVAAEASQTAAVLPAPATAPEPSS